MRTLGELSAALHARGHLANHLVAGSFEAEFTTVRNRLVTHARQVLPTYEDKSDPAFQVKSRHRVATTLLAHIGATSRAYEKSAPEFWKRDLNLIRALAVESEWDLIEIAGLERLHKERWEVENSPCKQLATPEWVRLRNQWRMRLGLMSQHINEDPDLLGVPPRITINTKCLAPGCSEEQVKLLEGAILKAVDRSFQRSNLRVSADQLTKHQLIKHKEEPMLDLNQPAITQRSALIFGKPAESVTDKEIYEAISDLEGQIEVLDKIQNKPKALQAQIKDLQGKIQALVDFSDSRYTSPAPSVPQPTLEP